MKNNITMCGGEYFSDCDLLVTCLLVELSWNSQACPFLFLKWASPKLSIKKKITCRIVKVKIAQLCPTLCGPTREVQEYWSG